MIINQILAITIMTTFGFCVGVMIGQLLEVEK